MLYYYSQHYKSDYMALEISVAVSICTLFESSHFLWDILYKRCSHGKRNALGSSLAAKCP